MSQNKKYIPKVGDIVLVWGKGAVTKILRYLIKRVFGAVDPPNHVQMVYDSEFDVSAEPGGVILMNREITFNNSKRIIIMRKKGLKPEEKAELLSESEKYFGKGYDYFLYVVWLLHIYLALLPFIPYTATKWYKWLKNKEEHSWACSELVSKIYSAIDFYLGVDDHMFQSPHIIYNTTKACSCGWKIVYSLEEKK